MPSGASQELWLQGWISGGLLALQACAAQPDPRAPEAAPALVETASEAGAPEASALAPPRPTAPDTSLSLAVYRAAGVPDVDHPWSLQDYQRCLTVFIDLLRSGRSDLPRAGSARSGALFARLVDARNFDPPAGIAAGERASRLESYLEVFPGFLNVYAPATDGIDFAVEQAELIVGLLELLKSALGSSRELSAVDTSWVKEYERQKQVTRGVVRGAGTMLAEERYSVPVRRHLRAHLARLAPELTHHLDPEAAREVHAIALE
jgi:hypothetical protein